MLARFSHSAGAAGVGPILAQPLAAYRADAGITKGPPCTIMGIRYHLAVNSTVLVADQIVSWGFIVDNEEIEAVDLNPSIDEHRSWMEWGKKQVTEPAGSNVSLVGNGDDGFRTVRSRRKFFGLEEDLWFALVLSTAGGGSLGYSVNGTVALALP